MKTTECADVRQYKIRTTETEQEIAQQIESHAQAGVALCYFTSEKAMQDWKNRLQSLC